MGHYSVRQHFHRFTVLWASVTFILILGYFIIAQEPTYSIVTLVAGAIIGVGVLLAAYIKKLLRTSKQDPLTKLLHRNSFIEELEKVIEFSHRHGQTFHLILIDINGFKRINDSLGHELGDVFLSRFTANLRDVVRGHDIVGRIGGDEFAVIIPESIGQVDCVDIIKRIISVSNTPTVINEHQIHSGVSIGLVSYPKDGTTAVNLMRCADIAVHSAKSMQKEFAVYSHEQDRYRISDLELIGDLKAAIDLDQIELWFQPKQSLQTGKVTGVESLVRWKHPIRGMVPPDKFIPIAEEIGIIKYLTHNVIQKATCCYKQLSSIGYDIDVSINVSPNDIVDPSTMTTIIQNIVKSDMPPNRLILEVTETSIMHDPEAAFKVLVALESLGVRISLADFGTGHSSLVYLKNFPIHEIKLDKSFIINIKPDSPAFHIVKSTIDLAHRIGAIVVAEGVEHSSIEDMMKEVGCDYQQGYYIARPMPLNDLIEWLKLHQPTREHDD